MRSNSTCPNQTDYLLPKTCSFSVVHPCLINIPNAHSFIYSAEILRTTLKSFVLRHPNKLWVDSMSLALLKANLPPLQKCRPSASLAQSTMSVTSISLALFQIHSSITSFFLIYKKELFISTNLSFNYYMIFYHTNAF